MAPKGVGGGPPAMGLAGLLAGIQQGVALKKAGDRAAPEALAPPPGRGGKASFRTELKNRMARKQKSIMKREQSGGSSGGDAGLDAMAEEDEDEDEGDEGNDGASATASVDATTVQARAPAAPIAPPIARPAVPMAVAVPVAPPLAAGGAPAWKQQIARQNQASKVASELDSKKKADEAKWDGVPAWKRKVLEEKAAKQAMKDAPKLEAERREAERKVGHAVPAAPCPVAGAIFP